MPFLSKVSKVKQLFSVPKSINISYPNDYVDSTTSSVPTSEPGTSQLIWTVTSNDLPTVTPTPTSFINTGFLIIAGKNTSGTSRTVYWKLIKNGSTVQSGNSAVSNNYYYTINTYNSYDVKVNDVLELRIWADGTGVDIQKRGYFALVIRLLYSMMQKNALCNASITSTYKTFGNGSSAVFPNLNIGKTTNAIGFYYQGNSYFGCLPKIDPSYGLINSAVGDSDSLNVNFQTSSSTLLRTFGYYALGSIKFKYLNISL